MINSKGELETSIPSKCKHYKPIMDKPLNVRCSKLGLLYECENMEGNESCCVFCSKFKLNKK